MARYPAELEQPGCRRLPGGTRPALKSGPAGLLRRRDCHDHLPVGRVRFPAPASAGLTRGLVRRVPAPGGLPARARPRGAPAGRLGTADLVCGPENEGGPDVAHGGWTAGALDEVLGHVPLLTGELAVTGQLSVTYVKPVPVGRPLHARAWTVRREGRRWYVAGELTLVSTGAVLGRGEAVMVLRDRGHFARHQEWLAQQDQA